MKIAVIGIGAIGGTLARRLVAEGNEVWVANSRGKDAARSFADEVGAVPADLEEAVNAADAVVLAIPQPAMATLPKTLFASLPSTAPVIDTSNYYPGLRDQRIPALEAGQTESVWVSEQIGRPVIKAFNNILAYSLANLAQPAGNARRLAVAVAGDSEAQKKLVMDLVGQIGFDAVDSGSLADSWRQQPCTPAYCCDYSAAEMRQALSAAVEGAAARKREDFVGRLPELFAQTPSHEEVVAFNRAFNTAN